MKIIADNLMKPQSTKHSFALQSILLGKRRPRLRRKLKLQIPTKRNTQSHVLLQKCKLMGFGSSRFSVAYQGFFSEEAPLQHPTSSNSNKNNTQCNILVAGFFSAYQKKIVFLRKSQNSICTLKKSAYKPLIHLQYLANYAINNRYNKHYQVCMNSSNVGSIFQKKAPPQGVRDG